MRRAVRSAGGLEMLDEERNPVGASQLDRLRPTLCVADVATLLEPVSEEAIDQPIDLDSSLLADGQVDSRRAPAGIDELEGGSRLGWRRIEADPLMTHAIGEARRILEKVIPAKHRLVDELLQIAQDHAGVKGVFQRDDAEQVVRVGHEREDRIGRNGDQGARGTHR